MDDHEETGLDNLNHLQLLEDTTHPFIDDVVLPLCFRFQVFFLERENQNMCQKKKPIRKKKSPWPWGVCELQPQIFFVCFACPHTHRLLTDAAKQQAHGLLCYLPSNEARIFCPSS